MLIFILLKKPLKPEAHETEIIEKIDIGGISLIRAAAKNFNDVVILASKDDYATLQQQLEAQNGETTLAQRKAFAKKAFHTSSHYDTAIFNYFNNEEPLTVFKQSINQLKPYVMAKTHIRKVYFMVIWMQCSPN